MRQMGPVAAGFYGSRAIHCMAIRQFLTVSIALAGLFGLAGYAFSQETTPATAQLSRREAQLLDQLKAQKQPDPYLLHELGTICYRQGKIFDARKQWNEASSREPNLPNADVETAHELMSLRKFDAARVALDNAEEKDKDNPHAAVARGRLALLENDTAAARAQFERAAKLNPKLPSVGIWLGRLSERAGDLAAAATYFTGVTRLAPQRPDGWLSLARVYFQQENTAAALESLRQAEKTETLPTAAEAQMAELYAGVNDFVSAMQWYRRAVERKPGNDTLRRGLAVVQIRLGMQAEAVAQLEQVLKGEEDINVMILLAQLEEELMHPERAEAMYRQALKIDPQHMVANNNLAMLQVKNGKAGAESVQLAEAALKTAPKHAHVLGTYGCALAAVGKLDQAREPLTQAVRRNPGEAWSRYYLAKVLLASGDRDQARDYLEGCLILDPHFPRADDVRKMTDELKSR